MHARKPKFAVPEQADIFADLGQFPAIVRAATPHPARPAPEKVSSVASNNMRAPGCMIRLSSDSPSRGSGRCSSTYPQVTQSNEASARGRQVRSATINRGRSLFSRLRARRSISCERSKQVISASSSAYLIRCRAIWPAPLPTSKIRRAPRRSNFRSRNSRAPSGVCSESMLHVAKRAPCGPSYTSLTFSRYSSKLTRRISRFSSSRLKTGFRRSFEPRVRALSASLGLYRHDSWMAQGPWLSGIGGQRGWCRRPACLFSGRWQDGVVPGRRDACATVPSCTRERRALPRPVSRENSRLASTGGHVNFHHHCRRTRSDAPIYSSAKCIPRRQEYR